MTRILLVEDDDRLAGLVREYLEANHLHVDVESRGDRALERIVEEQPDLVVLDVMLPGMDGFEVCRRARASYAGPIFILTARDGEVDEVLGLELGADDYMAKPVRPRLLLARIHSLLRRSADSGSVETSTANPVPDLQKAIAVGTLHVDPGSRQAMLGGQRLQLTTAEFELLWLLARHVGEVLSRDRIYTELRGIEYNGVDRSMDLRVARLRRKLGDDSADPQLIKAVRGVGYMLAAAP